MLQSNALFPLIFHKIFHVFIFHSGIFLELYTIPVDKSSLNFKLRFHAQLFRSLLSLPCDLSPSSEDALEMWKVKNQNTCWCKNTVPRVSAFHTVVSFHHKGVCNIAIQHDIIQYITHVITHSTHFTIIMFLVAPIEPSTLL